MTKIRAGVDIGKMHPHVVVVNEEGEWLLSRRIEKDETELLALIGDIRRCAVIGGALQPSETPVC
ncbi:transposase [Kitasatospora sp. NPDC059648]|uniref:IS110 family transposase n=1 Tax=Kitasatospora sp. NPDC059648 TaxID=3346894 RepID=UPI003687E7E6